MVYGGPFLAHYGHFLLSSLSRLWAIDGSLPVLFHSAAPMDGDHADTIQRLRVASGLHDHCFSLDRPMRIKNLIVPQAALYEQHSVARAYAIALSAVGRNIRCFKVRAPKKVCLSKSRLHSGVAGLDGEDYIDKKMHMAGFDVVYQKR